MQKINCAIYVRKSSDRGLDQEFNSLDNQELACKSYIASQTFQGWEYTRTYGDAAISGGTMARPGLKEMLTDIRAGKIQCVLVYKIDRLSRSIYDFKRMMKEEFEKHECNLVSITQSFDTSTAMGKLTLNMLLSFAEFEREVASERVRDKMRATKSKGMWVGGVTPLGYNIEFGKLVINQSEVPTVRNIFQTYMESSSISDCRERLIVKGIRGKTWTTKKGVQKGGTIIAVSSLQRILTNQLYLGKMPNKSTKEVFNGQHDAILDEELFNAVQEKLTSNNVHGDAPYARGASLLHDKIYTSDGEPFKNKKGNKGLKKYRYYKAGKISLPAGDIEKIVCDTLGKFLNSEMVCLSEEKRLAFKQVEFSEAIIQPMVEKIVYNQNKLTIFINVSDLGYLNTFKKDRYINQAIESMPCYITDDGKYAIIEEQVHIASRTCINHRCDGGEVSVLTKSETASMLIKAIAYGWKYKHDYENGMQISTISESEKRDKRTIYKYLNLAYLSPRIVNDIMNSELPIGINLQSLFGLASKYDDFNQQETAFYGC